MRTSARLPAARRRGSWRPSPSIPLAPRFADHAQQVGRGSRSAAGAAAPGRRRGRGPASRTRRRATPPWGRNAPTSRATRPSNGSSQASSSRSTARRATRSAVAPGLRPLRPVRPSGSVVAFVPRQRGEQLRIDRDPPLGAAARDPGSRWSRSSTTSASVSATSRWVARVVGVAPTCSTTSGRWARQPVRIADQELAGGQRSTGLPGVEPQARQRLGQHRPAQERPRATAATESRGRAPGAEGDRPRAGPRSVARNARARRAPHPHRRARSGLTGGASAAPSRRPSLVGHERLLERAVHLDGTRRARRSRPRLRAGPRRTRPRRPRATSGTGGSRYARAYRPYSSRLIDRLVRAGAAQPRRAVGGQHDQRHPRLRRLDDRGEVLGGRGAARARQRDGRAGRLREPEREERARCARPDARARGPARRAPAPARAASSASPARRTRRARPARRARRPGRSRTRARRRRGPSRHRLRQEQAEGEQQARRRVQRSPCRPAPGSGRDRWPCARPPAAGSPAATRPARTAPTAPAPPLGHTR